MNKFQIIIPVFRYQEYLDKCIDSIRIQEYPKELIKIHIIDDFSDEPLKINGNELDINLIRNEERLYAGYNRFKIFTNCKDDDIIIFLDGDDWLSDSQVLQVINDTFNNNKIHWSISNHKIYKNSKIKVLPVFVNLPLEISKPRICHLRCGYGYVWNNMEIDWLKKDNKIIKWMTDWNENIYALKHYGQPFKIESSLSVYNNDSSKTRNENKDYYEMINWFDSKSVK